MKLKLVIVTALLGLFVAVHTASARKITKQDRALVEKAMKHMGAIADRLDEGAKAENPNKALDKLEAYMKRNGDAIRALIKKLEAIEKELDEDEKKKLEEETKNHRTVKKLTAAMTAFFQKHGSNQKAMARLQAILEQLDSNKK